MILNNIVFQTVVIIIIALILIYTAISESENPNKTIVHDETIAYARKVADYENKHIEFPYKKPTYVLPD